MDTINYLPLLIIFVIAWAVPFILSWFEITKVPAVIVSIVMGVIVGPYVLDWVEDVPYLDFLAKTGFLFLIFLAGLEIDIAKITSSWPKGRIKGLDLVSNSLIVAIIIYFGSLLLSIPFAWLVHQFIPIDIVFLTILLPTVALSITLPILKADGELSRKFGQIMLMEGAISTIMSIILIAVYSGILKNGFQVELLLFTFIFVAFVVVYFVGKRLIKLRTFQALLYQLEHAASQIRVRGTVALLLFFVFIAHLIETELVLGAFVAGLLLSIFVSKERSPLLFKLDGMSYGFFIPIFFIKVGIDLDLSALANFQESVPFILTILGGFFLTQVIPALIMIKIFGLKKALAGGILLTARMGLTIATAQIGLSLDLISQADNTGIVTASILASLISPLLYKMLGHEGEQHYNIYIFGGSKASLYLAERMQMHGVLTMTLLNHKVLVDDFHRKGLVANYVPNMSTESIDRLHLRTADMVVVLTQTKNLNAKISKYIENELGHKKIITLWKTKHMDPESELNHIDIDKMLAHHVEDIILRPDSLNTLAESFNEYRVEEITMSNEKLHGKMVKEVVFPPQGSLVLLSRSKEIFIPHGNTHLLEGDKITVIGNSDALIEFRNILTE